MSWITPPIQRRQSLQQSAADSIGKIQALVKKRMALTGTGVIVFNHSGPYLYVNERYYLCKPEMQEDHATGAESMD